MHGIICYSVICDWFVENSVDVNFQPQDITLQTHDSQNVSLIFRYLLCFCNNSALPLIFYINALYPCINLIDEKGSRRIKILIV